jgi:GDP-L-fucose synthase
MLTYDQKEFVNIGTGTDVTIKELAETIASIVGFNGELVWDSTKPDGTPRKLMNVGRIHASGWKHEIDLKEGIKQVYKEFTNNELAL